MKKLIGIFGIFITMCVFAADPTTRTNVTSLKYVENQLGNRQDTVPAKSGDKAITPTGTSGAIGERDIKTTLGNEATNQSDGGIPTVETVNTALGEKQEKIKKLPSVNIMTYTGTGTNVAGTYGAGIVTSTPIYDSTTNTYGNGLVRASTLNSAVQTGVNRALTQVPAGFVINNIGDVLPTTIYFENFDPTTNRFCLKRILTDATAQTYNWGCSDTLYNSMVKGDWGVVTEYKTGITYPGDTCTGTNCYKEIYGISACSSEGGSSSNGVADPVNIFDTLQSAYETYKTTGVPSGNSNYYCHCKVINPHIGTSNDYSPWVYAGGWVTGNTGESCALHCTEYCVYYARAVPRFRAALFGGVAIPQQTNQSNE